MRFSARNHPGYEPTDPPPPPLPSPVRPSFFARPSLARTLALIAAACTGIAGVITATGATIVNVIDSAAEARARRTNVEIDRRLDAIEVRVNGRFGLDLEEKARREKDAELEDEVARMRDQLRRLERKP